MPYMEENLDGIFSFILIKGCTLKRMKQSFST